MNNTIKINTRFEMKNALFEFLYDEIYSGKIQKFNFYRIKGYYRLTVYKTSQKEPVTLVFPICKGLTNKTLLEWIKREYNKAIQN